MINKYSINDLQIGLTENRRPVLMRAIVHTGYGKRCQMCGRFKTDFFNNTKICMKCYTKQINSN